MKTKIILTLAFLTVLFILSVNLISASLSDVKYPVAELGNCNSQAECEKYCDDLNNMEPCLNFAEKNGIMTSDEIAEARKFMPLMKSGNTPGKCSSEKQCKVYCDKEENLNECIEFAISIGEIDSKEAEMIKKTGGKGPGGCKGKKECDDFCNIDTNFNTCIDFAKEKGLISSEDYEMAKKTGGKGPGGCKKDECNTFCNNEANFNVCADFAYEHGMMTKEDYEMAKKTGGKGPGGCKGKEECDAFCKNPDNQETCTNFAIEHDLLSGQELENMKKNQEFMNSEEGKCKTQCLKDAGLDSKACGENGAGPEACKTCDEKCFSNNEKGKSGNCLSQAEWEQKNQACKSQGDNYHLQEVKGDDGNGGECVVDETCVQGSGDQWETQAEKDKRLADMQKQWAEEEAQHEAQYGPGTQGTEVYSGGCTQPGPEGQCNPGPGAGSGPDGEGGGSGGTTTGEGSGGGSTSDGGSSGGSSEGGSSGGGGGGESAPVSGSVILEGSSNNNWFLKIIKWIFGI